MLSYSQYLTFNGILHASWSFSKDKKFAGLMIFYNKKGGDCSFLENKNRLSRNRRGLSDHVGHYGYYIQSLLQLMSSV